MQERLHRRPRRALRPRHAARLQTGSRKWVAPVSRCNLNQRTQLQRANWHTQQNKTTHHHTPQKTDADAQGGGSMTTESSNRQKKRRTRETPKHPSESYALRTTCIFRGSAQRADVIAIFQSSGGHTHFRKRNAFSPRTLWDDKNVSRARLCSLSDFFFHSYTGHGRAAHTAASITAVSLGWWVLHHTPQHFYSDATEHSRSKCRARVGDACKNIRNI